MAGTFSGSVVGYVAKDPEPRANGKAVGFSVPVSKGKDKPTTWVRVTCWGKTAEFVSQYVKGTSLELNAQSVQSFRTGEPTAAAAPKAAVADDVDPW
jgi:single-stranded DNA-binding protein